MKHLHSAIVFIFAIILGGLALHFFEMLPLPLFVIYFMAEFWNEEEYHRKPYILLLTILFLLYYGANIYISVANYGEYLNWFGIAIYIVYSITIIGICSTMLIYKNKYKN